MDILETPKKLYRRYHPKKVYGYVMSDRKRQLAAVAVVAIIVVAAFAMLDGPGGDEGDTATFDDLLASQSTRTQDEQGGSIVVTDECPWYAVVATPVAVHYEETGERMATPLVVAGQVPTLPVKRFLQAYNRPTVITIGPVGDLSVPKSWSILEEDVKHTSIAIAEAFWTQSDGVMITRGDFDGYQLAVAAAPMASYLDIPIIVCDEVCDGVRSTLSGLGVKYSLVLGDAEGYGNTIRIDSVQEAQQMCQDFITDPMGLAGEVEYLTIANPEDIHEKTVVANSVYSFQDDILDHDRPAPVHPGTTQVDREVDYEFDIPVDYEFANVRFTLKFTGGAWVDERGSRIYGFVFDGDENDDTGQPAQEGFFGTPAGRVEGEWRIVDFDLPMNNDTGKHLVSVSAREVWTGNPLNPQPVTFQLDIEVQKLDDPVYPLMERLSAMAPYLTAFRQGIVMADPSFALMEPSYIGCVACDEPTVNEGGLEAANTKALEVHNETVRALARLVGQETPDLMEDAAALNALAEHYYYDPIHVGIIADTNMVPHYYHPGGMAQEGYGEPGDIIYGDVNLDPAAPPYDLGDGHVRADYPDLELPVGRIDGYEYRDVSALLSRTFFYDEIIDSFNGYLQGDLHSTWKNNGYVFLGSEIPVESMYGSMITQLKGEYQDGGFNPKSTSEVFSHREHSQQFQEGSNFIVGGVHGFYYWYVPAARTKYAGGSAYDVAHVRDMNFGPSNMFMVSCVVGRIDGLNPENALAMAYMHGGMNAFIGATRSTYGWVDAGSDGDVRLDSEGAVLLGEYYAEYVLKDDQTVGMALRDAKNAYVIEDAEGGLINDIGPEIAFMIYGHYILHGDPAFNPYEPNHG